MWEKAVKFGCGAAGAVAGWFGGWDALLTVLVCAMTLDYVSGVIVAACGRSDKTENGGLSSKAGFKGLLRKGMTLAVVLTAALLDRAVGEGNTFRTATVAYYIANEGLSILENAALLEVPIPKKLREALEERSKD